MIQIHDERIMRQERCVAYMLHKMRNELLEPEVAAKIDSHFKNFLREQQKINRATAAEAVEVD